MAGRAGLWTGFASLGRASRLLRSHRELWLWCALPLGLNLVAFGLASMLFLNNLGAISEGLTEWMSISDPESWYGWLWVGPLRLLEWLTGWLLLLFLAVVIYFTFTLVGGVIAAPFLDVLSRRVERIHTGGVFEAAGASLWAGAARALLEEGKRTLFFLGGQAFFLLIGLVPGLQPIALIGSVGFAVLFLPLDYTGYLFDRRGLRFRERRQWVMRHRRAMLGFGATALALFLVPGLNFLCLPWLVSAGTLLGLELGAPGDA